MDMSATCLPETRTRSLVSSRAQRRGLDYVEDNDRLQRSNFPSNKKGLLSAGGGRRLASALQPGSEPTVGRKVYVLFNGCITVDPTGSKSRSQDGGRGTQRELK